MATATARERFVILAAATAMSLPARCQAATAALPWDQTLIVLQDMLINIVAPAAIALAFSGAVILYALGGHDKEAGRLAGPGSAAASRSPSFYLLNYVLP